MEFNIGKVKFGGSKTVVIAEAELIILERWNMLKSSLKLLNPLEQTSLISNLQPQNSRKDAPRF